MPLSRLLLSVTGSTCTCCTDSSNPVICLRSEERGRERKKKDIRADKSRVSPPFSFCLCVSTTQPVGRHDDAFPHDVPLLRRQAPRRLAVHALYMHGVAFKVSHKELILSVNSTYVRPEEPVYAKLAVNFSFLSISFT